MVRKIALGAATTLVVVGLPVPALGFSQSLEGDYTPTVTPEPVQTSEQMELEAQKQLGTPPGRHPAGRHPDSGSARAREMTHAETGVFYGHLPRSCLPSPAATTLGGAPVSA